MKKPKRIVGLYRMKNREEDAAAIAAFMKSGGKINKLIELEPGKEDEYDKNLKAARKKSPGAFNPFSKEEALSVREK